LSKTKGIQRKREVLYEKENSGYPGEGRDDKEYGKAEVQIRL
jgi:hypothetical protein